MMIDNKKILTPVLRVVKDNNGMYVVTSHYKDNIHHVIAAKKFKYRTSAYAYLGKIFEEAQIREESK
jgi:hypothetical protein